MRTCSLLAALALLTALAARTAQAVEIVIATVDNGHMIRMQKLTRFFEQDHPGIRVRWETMNEGTLRQRVSVDIATGQGRFDVVTLGMLEAPVWGRRGWLRPIDTEGRPGDAAAAAYDAADLLPTIRESLSADGRLYAAPFYGESSVTMLRQDLLDRAGIKLPDPPTWEQIGQAAARLHDPAQGVHGICLRGKPGWGENMTLITPIANGLGGQWFDMAWRPRLDSEPWKQAVSLYIDLLRRWGPPGAVANGYNQNLALFSAGRCAIWVDATVAASFVNDPRHSRVAGKVRLAAAPVGRTAKGTHWLWAWALAVPISTPRAEAAQQFIRWATSKAYVRLVAREFGWQAVPSGTRRSTYADPAFRAANPHADIERRAIESADPHDSTEPRSPYVGV